MDVSLLDVKHFHAELAEKRDQRFEGKIGEMFVINCVVFQLLNQVSKVRRFENKCALRREEQFDRFYKLSNIIDMSEHVCSRDNGRATFFVQNSARDFDAEKFI